MMKIYLLGILVIYFTLVCKAQEYDEYRPEEKRAIKAESYQYNDDFKTTTTPAPIAILKQINRHNEDGSYTYGYEGADGSFKIETKAANGDVKGKYGYFDGEKIRVVEYGANRHGFQPSGEGITVPPPNLDEKYINEDEDIPPQRQAFASAPKFSKQNQAPAYHSQQPNYPQNFERKKFVTQTPPIAQEYYDYEEEKIAPTQKPVQSPRPKFQQQQQFAPVTTRQQPQYANADPIDIIYADERFSKPVKQQSQYEPTFENRQPAQFPQEPARPLKPSYVNHANELSLFTPVVGSRADIFKPNAPKPPSPPQHQQPSYANVPESSFQFSPQSFHPQKPVYTSKPTQSRSTSILDQLAKDFALPQSSAPLHDISFGYQL